MPNRLLIVAIIVPLTASSARADDAGVEFYETKVRPVLAEHCYSCHGPDKQEASLSVDTVAGMLRGGDQGPAIVPGDVDNSLLVKGIRYDDLDFQMPPKGKIGAEKIAAIEQWITMGAPAPPNERRVAKNDPKKEFNLAERAKHWCFQPLTNAPVPPVQNARWPRGDIDRFIIAKLEAAGLTPAAEADPRVLCRRLYFDLIGLPPTPEEVEEFVAAVALSPSPLISPSSRQERAGDKGIRGGGDAAYAALVDKLLASPHFGERWGRHWLDLVRYAETRGHEYDYLIPNAYQYRDYVIRAFNADVPYDRFVVEHLAGDMLPTPRVNPKTGANESILGTGFWFLGEECHSPVDIRQDETDRVDNKIDVMSKTFLGVTLACARCHDHKFDALSTRDYYAMAGFVLSMSYRQTAFEADTHNRRVFEDVKKLEAEYRPALLKAQYELWRPMLEKADKYLLASRDVIVELRKGASDADRAAVLTATANRYELDERRLEAWVQYAESTTGRAKVLSGWYEAAGGKQKNAPESAEVVESTTFQPRVLVDYARPADGQWQEDGFAFGGGPRTTGAIRFGSTAERPVVAVESLPNAAVDPKWDVVRPAEGSEAPPGRFNWRQTGRTLKTPTFTLQTGRLWYLVRGSGRVYAQVATHRMNNGPLHGALIKQFPGDDAYHWVEHDLSAYAGQRVHLEFSPYDAGELKENQSPEFGIRGIIENPTPNPLPIWYFGDGDELSQAAANLAGPGLSADEFQRTIQTAAHEFRSDNAAADIGRSWTIDWMLEHPELWSMPSAEAAAMVEPFFTKQTALMAQLKRASHTAPAAWEGSGVDECVLIRGNHRTTGDVVPRRFLEAIDGATPPRYETAGGRLELAERMVDARDPLPARVMVNRLWQHLFGRGLVKTVDNFGIMGEPPTHPELLDHLARQFMAEGWSTKRLIREMVLSSTYRMSSSHLAASLATRSNAESQTVDPEIVDPDNNLYHRAQIRRLDAEIIRDSLLAVSGRLDRRQFGPSVEVYLTPFMEGRGKPSSGPLDGDGRRSVYLRVRRNFLNPMFQAYDYPTPFTTVGRRSESNVPAQALVLMNGELVVEQAKLWAARAIRDVPDDPRVRIERLYLEAFARRPTVDELSAAQEFLHEQRRLYAVENADDPRPWADLCHVLFNVKEFVFIP